MEEAVAGEPVEETPRDEDEVEEDNLIFGEDGGLNPDHPLLLRAQQALKAQLLKTKQGLEEDLRVKGKALKDAEIRRESIGVELYGFQQQLANLQIALEKAHENYNEINRIRHQADDDLRRMRKTLEEDETINKKERAKADQIQEEMDRLSAALKQIELHNEDMKGEIAVTRRATYATEEAVQKLEKDKKEQDFLIEKLQENLRVQSRHLQLYSAQFEAQKRETRAAQEMLAEAESEMEGIHFEKQQLLAQWRSSVLAIQRRDEALKDIDRSISEQDEQSMAIDTEINAYKRDTIKEQVKNEQLTAVLQKNEGEMHHLTHRIAELRQKQEHLQEMYSKFQSSLEQTEEKMARACMESKAITAEADSVRKSFVKVSANTQDFMEQIEATLGEQSTTERSSQKSMKDTHRLRKAVANEEMLAINIQNELAKLQVDILNTQSHNDRLTATLKLLNEELKDKEKIIEKCETDIRRRNDDIGKQTREVDKLNRKYEKLTADMEDESTGPLEATINNLQREIQRKGVEAQELQRRWIGFQIELVELQKQNNKLSESLATFNCKHTVVFQKRRRLGQQFDHQTREIKNLNMSMQRLHSDIQRLNAQIAKNSGLEAALQNDNFNLENEIIAELEEMEEHATRLESQIDAEREEKRNVLSDIIEAEREIMLWERRLQLEEEMQRVLDPEAGQDVALAMRKEIHRMELRHAELLRVQEKMIMEMERAIGRRDSITMKGKAATQRQGPDMTESQLRKATTELKRSIRATKKEAQATDDRTEELDKYRAGLAEQLEHAGNECKALKEREQVLKKDVDVATAKRSRALFVTAQQQRAAKRYEDLSAGKYRPQVRDAANVKLELDKGIERQNIIVAAIKEMAEEKPERKYLLERVLMHAIATSD